MHVYELACRLIDIESITCNERQIGDFLFDHLAELGRRHGGRVERMHVEENRFNVLACWDDPVVTLSTHMDTVPPFFSSREDDEWIWGRGACDVKGLLAAMIQAAGELLEEGVRGFALLFVVGEERNSMGAFEAARHPRGSRYLINGEPTGNKLALGSKGAVRYEITATGRMAHSAYPNLGESAIDKLLDVLAEIRAVQLPSDPVLGDSTLNVGLIHGGRAGNVVADRAQAEVMIRLVDDGVEIREAVLRATRGRADAKEVFSVQPVRLGTLEGFETCVVAFTTDIPAFQGAWGEPYLIGPGSIHLAHTSEERIQKRELLEAVTIYKNMVKRLLTS